jgi:hypothetical protein
MFNKILFGFCIAETSPIWGGAFIALLGRSVNREALGESGYVNRIYAINNTKDVEKPYSRFENILASTGSAGWLLITGMGFLYVPYVVAALPCCIDHIRVKGLK